MEKINIAELLKDCPRDMELGCTVYEDVYFDYIGKLNIIHCYIQYEKFKMPITFNQYGTVDHDIKAKCVIFPKGKTTWEGFQRPFKDGDIVFYNNYVGIFKKWIDETTFRNYVDVKINGKLSVLCHNTNNFGKDITIEARLATEEEKQKLFDVIKEKGYKWNDKTKTLEQLIVQNFKDGDILITNCNAIFIYKGRHKWVTDCCDFYCAYVDNIFINKAQNRHCGEVQSCRYASEEEKQKLFDVIKKNGYKWNAKTKTLEKLTEPKFKVGDRIKHKNNCYAKYIIKEVYDSCYKTNCGTIPFELQDDYELVPNKFDITTLKPFDKVLVRCDDGSSWSPQFFAKYRPGSKFPFVCTYNTWSQCIPYEGNEHLSDTTEDCNEYYKIW